MQEYSVPMAIFTWIISGGVGNVIALILFMRGVKDYKERLRESVLKGRKVEKFLDILDKQTGLPFFFALFLGNMVALGGSMIYPIGLYIYGAILVVVSIRLISEYVEKNFLQQEHKVMRYLKKNPEMIVPILEDKNHSYYEYAKELHVSGELILDKAIGMVEIDGKKYKVKLK